MALAFRRATHGPLQNFDAAAPDGVVVGLIGLNGSGVDRVLDLASGAAQAQSGSVEASGKVRRLGPGDALDLSPVPVLVIDHTLARQDALARERAAIDLQHLRRARATVLLASHEDDLLASLCDEIWWLQDGKLAGRGDPGEILRAYRQHVVQALRAWGERARTELQPKWRRGDGRAEVVSIETLGENGQPTQVWRSGELAVVKIRVRFHGAVADPVVGIMIRTRIGLNVYGTNTELEKLKMGPCAPGDWREITFAFRCDLCPENYTLTVASHDPDGLWHDWLEDAISFGVGDDRYTAGVANLRATVSFTKG